jgi:hypothetical protein
MLSPFVGGYFFHDVTPSIFVKAFLLQTGCIICGEFFSASFLIRFLFYSSAFIFPLYHSDFKCVVQLVEENGWYPIKENLEKWRRAKPSTKLL